MRKMIVLLSMIVCLVLAACTGELPNPLPPTGTSPTASSSISSAPNESASNTVKNDITVRNDSGLNDHEPGVADVSTTVRNQPFDATPTYHYFAKCGRPCWLPVYPKPQLVKGTSVTDNYPYESYAGNAGDKVHVDCQVHGRDTGGTLVNGGILMDESGRTSDVWDVIVIKVDAKNVLGRPALITTVGLTPAAAGDIYAYAADIWLGNTGDHGIPCA